MTIATVRKIDKLGRIGLPIEMLRMLDISHLDGLEILVDGETIILQSAREESKETTLLRESLAFVRGYDDDLEKRIKDQLVI